MPEPGLEGHEREPVRILLLEDDRVSAEVFSAYLRRIPEVEVELHVAGTLASAHALLAQVDFDLIVADLNLPDSEGVATIESLTRTVGCPVIAMTSDEDRALRAATIASGAFDFLQKTDFAGDALTRLVRLAAMQARTFRSLRETEARFRSLTALSSDWYWEQDEELRFTRFEGRIAEVPGMLSKDVIGMLRWEIPGITPVSCSWEEHRRLLEARLPFRGFEYSRIFGEGVLKYVSASGEPVYDALGRFGGYRGLATDITSRKRAEEDLRRFRLAMDTSADMILLTDRASMRLVDVNTTTCRLLGYSREELLGMGPQDILPLTREELEKTYDRMIADSSALSGMRSYYRCKDGSQLPFESRRRVLRSGDAWLIAAISRDIRDRIASEKALRDSEARFRSLSALSSDWYWEQDEQLRLTFMSSIEELGLDPSKFLGRKRWDQPAINLTEADWDAHRTQLERHEPFRDFEMQRAAPDGGTVWLSLSGEPVFDETGRFTGYRGVGRDITQRKQTEREVRHLGRMYSALSAANEAILRARSPQEVFDKACEIAVEAGGFQLCTVFTVDAEAKTLSRAASSGMAASLVKGAAPPIDESQPGGGGLLGQACRTGRAVISNDYQSDARTQGQRERVRSYRPGSGGAFPLHIEGRLAGVFALQHAERGAFSDELTALLQRLTDDISFALDNFQREARRLAAEQELRKSEERFRSMTQLSSDMYWEQDDQYRFTSHAGTGGPKWLQSGRTRMKGRRRWDQNYFNMTEADWAAHKALLEAHQPFRDLELGRINEAGETVWVSVAGEPMFSPSGPFTGYRGVGKDITARKREERLVALEHKVTRFLAEADSASGALKAALQAVCETEVWECGRYLRVDEQAGVLRVGAVWGIPTETIQRFLESSRSMTYAPGQGLAGRVWQSGQPLWLADIGKDSRAAQISLIRELGLRGAVFFPMMVKDKMIGILAFNSREVREPEARLLQTMRVIGSQIGQFVQRKQAEDVLRESEERFRSLTTLSSDWYWEQDAAFRFTKFEGGERADGRQVAASAVLGRCVWDLEGVVQSSIDWDQYRARLQRHESFRQVEYSYRARSGKRYYISADGEPVFDEEGRFTGYRGTSRDITQQRRGEQELRRFRAAMDMSSDAIYLVDRATMRFLDVNEAACRGVGYSREQLLGMGPQDLLLTSKDELERDYDAAIARGAEGMMAETSYVAKNGRKGWTELHRRALRADDNWIIVSISRDITERKQAEQRQAGHLRHQERIARLGQSALARREPAELIDEAVQTVLEALTADAVAYLEPGPGERELVLRSVVGVAEAGTNPAAITCPPEDPVLQVFQTGAQKMIEGAALPFAWAHDLRSGALIPVRGERGVRGALCVCFRDPNAFAAEELNFAEAVASVLSTGLQRIDSEGRLAFLAQFDPLTGLPNRALLSDRFSQMIVQAQRHDSRLGVLFIDLDEFKMVNDTLGHAGGDDLLKEVAVRLQSTVRQGDTVARISGDEFAVVLADLAQPEDAALVAQKIIDHLATAVGIQGQEVFVTASIGIATFPDDGGDAETLIGAADAAMYRAKQSGRNAYQFFTTEINQRSRTRAQLGSELRRAVEREEFALVYQPKYDLAKRQICGAEALLRWKHPERGTVSPMEFIPVLEETGLIVQVGEWVLRRACEDLKAWQAAGLQVVPVAVNLSARQFRQQDLAERIKALVRAAGVAHALIELEITESQLMQDPDHAIRVMRSLCEAGMRIAIDDFGTGYSSLSYLTRFPVSSLKIDRSFVADVNVDPSDAAIVRTIIEMAHTLGFTVVAEGIETEAQAEYLRRHGCEQAQGYLFARPMPAADFAGLLAKTREQALI